jgi:putative DNA primase/helicase
MKETSSTGHSNHSPYKYTALKPNFDLSIVEKEVEPLAAIDQEADKHSEILGRLLEQVEPVDFQALAFEQVPTLRQRLEEAQPDSMEAERLQDELKKLKPKEKHYLVITVEQVLNLAKTKGWGLCKNLEFIYVYNGAYWTDVDKNAFQNFLGEAAEKMGVPTYDARLCFFRDKLFKQFLTAAYLPSPESDKNKVLINLANGTFEFTPNGTQKRPFDPSDFLTYQLPFKYDPEAKAPLFEKYLSRVLPDIERQKVLAEYMGYIFIKHGSAALKEEKALVLYGTGANGKSVFFEVVTALLGSQNVSNYSIQSLTEPQGYYRAKLANILLNYASEINGKLEASLFKQMVSGEPVEARLPYGQPFTMHQYAKMIFNCNELPKDVEHTNAYFRRFLIIPFDVTIPEHEQDKTLHTRIKESELSGVFNWVLDGLSRLLEQKGFSNCEAAKQAVEQYRTESDSVQMFLGERGYKPSIKDTITLAGLFTKYKDYCSDNGNIACSNINFSRRLKHSGYNIEKARDGRLVYIEKESCF